MESSEHMDRAANLLRHYMAMLFETAGLKWDTDNNVEMDEIVFHIVEASK